MLRRFYLHPFTQVSMICIRDCPEDQRSLSWAVEISSADARETMQSFEKHEVWRDWQKGRFLFRIGIVLPEGRMLFYSEVNCNKTVTIPYSH